MNTSTRGYTIKNPKNTIAGNRYSQPFRFCFSIAASSETDSFLGFLAKEEYLMGF